MPRVAGDAAALQRVLSNLLTNAIKYGGEAGWVGLRVCRSDVDGNPGVEVSVTDRGPGISRSDLPRIFEPFYRGHDAVNGHAQGSGLGLSLIKHIVEAHGGRVRVELPDAGGTMFSVHLPGESS